MDIPRTFDDLKTSKKVYGVMLFCIFKGIYILKVYSVYYTLKESTNVKTFLSDKISGRKNAFFLLSGAPSYHSVTFNLKFLYELKLKFCLYKTVCGIFHFDSVSFLWKFISLFKKIHFLLDLKNVIIPFNMKIIEKPDTVLLLDLWFLSCKKKF